MKQKAFSQLLGLLLFSFAMAFGSLMLGANNTVASMVGGASFVTPFVVQEHQKGNVLYVNNPDVSALAAYAGTYEKALFRKMVNSMSFINQVGKMLNVPGKINMTKLITTANVRPHSNTEHMQGTLVYEPRVLETKRGKVELPLNPVDYRDTWMNELMTREITAKELPFAQFIFESIMASTGEEINNRTFYYGFDKADAVLWDTGDTYAVGDYIYFTPSGDVLHYYKCVSATSTGQSPSTHAAKWQKVDAEAFFPGLKILIEDEVTGGDITEVTTGSVTSGSTAFAAAKELFRAMGKPYREKGAAIFMSYTDYDFLADGIDDKYFTNSGDASGRRLMFLPGTDNKCAIVPATWLMDSRRLICTDPKNIVFGTNLLSDFNNIKIVESELWTLKLGMAFEGGVQIRDTDGIVVGDQD